MPQPAAGSAVRHHHDAGVCAILYISVALVLTGIARYDTLNNAAPVANALKVLGYNGIRQWVSVGALWACSLRCWSSSTDRRASGSPCRATACCRKHVLQGPPGAPDARTSARGSRARGREFPPASGTSRRSRTWRISGRCSPSSSFRWESSCCARRSPTVPRGFRVPGAPWLPMISIVFCLVLMMALPLETWVRFFVWLIDRLRYLLPLQPQTQRCWLDSNILHSRSRPYPKGLLAKLTARVNL